MVEIKDKLVTAESLKYVNDLIVERIIEIPIPQLIIHTSTYTEESIEAMRISCEKIIATRDEGRYPILIQRCASSDGYHMLNFSYNRGVFKFIGFEPYSVFVDNDGNTIFDYFIYIEYDYINNTINKYNPVANLASYGDWIESWEDAAEIEDIPSFNAMYLMCQSVLTDAKKYTDEKLLIDTEVEV